METHNDRSNEQGKNFNDRQTTKGHTVSAHNEDATAERLNAARSQDDVDAERGDDDDFTTNGLDQSNTMGNDDNPAGARESGTR